MLAVLIAALAVAPAGAQGATPPLALCTLGTPPPAYWNPMAALLSAGVGTVTAQQLGPFVTPGTGTLATPATAAWAACDGETLYVRVECTDPDLAGLLAPELPRDSEQMWQQDAVEVFVAPSDPTKEYFHLVVSAANGLYDARVPGDVNKRDPSWDSKAVTEVTKEQALWACTIRLPLASLGATPQLGDRWRLNVCREYRGGNAVMSWAALQGGFHEPQAFGTLVFAPQVPVLQTEMSAPFVGRNRATVTLALHVKAEAFVQVSQQTGTGISRLGPDGEYTIPDEGSGTAQLEVRDAHGVVVARSPAVAFSAPPLAPSSGQVTAWLDGVRKVYANLLRRGRAGAALTDALRAAETDVQSLAAWVDGAPRRRAARNAVAWPQKGEACRMLTSTVARLATITRALDAAQGEGAPAFVLGTETSLRKLHPTDWDFTAGEPLRLAAARRESESAQVVVAPMALGERAAPPVRVATAQCSDLVAAGGARLASGAVRIDRVGYVTTRQPVYPIDYVGEWPDPLMPLEPFTVEPGRIQPLWVTVTVPAEQAAGEYRGTLTVTDGAGATAKLPVELTVWDFALPLRGRLKTAISTGYGDIAAWYGWTEGSIPVEFRHRLYDLMLSHRLNPCCIYSGNMWPPIEDLDYCVARGLNSACMKCTGSANPQEIAEVRERLAALRARGLEDGAYIYGFDEAQPATWPDVKKVWQAWKDAIPGVKIAGTYPPNDVLNPVVDIWVPLTPWYDGEGAKDIAAARRAEGDEMWFYVCCGPGKPFQNWFIDFPSTDHRGLFWATYKYGITGFLYYQTTMWASNMHTKPAADWEVDHEDPAALAAIEAGKRWPEVPWNTFTFSRFNGDGLLVYPGPHETPLSTVRLENIRDGIEDYEMLCVLANLAKDLPVLGKPSALGRRAQELLAVNPDLTTDLTHYTTDPKVIEGERAKVAACILEVQEAVGRARP